MISEVWLTASGGRNLAPVIGVKGDDVMGAFNCFE